MEVTKEQLEKERLRTLKMLENSYLMHEETIKETRDAAKRRKGSFAHSAHPEEDCEKTIQLLETAQQDVVAQYLQAGGTLEKLESLKKSKKKTIDRKVLENIVKKETAKDEMAEYIAKMRAQDIQTPEQVEEVPTPIVDVNPEPEKPVYETPKADDEFARKMEEMRQADEAKLNTTTQPVNNFQGAGKQMFDIINLPSKGQCYRVKRDKVKVAYLTAYDENMILSPNLYKDGNFIDYLLKAKVLENDIDVEDLTQGDRDAIILWLRATGYGNDYPIVVTDDTTGKEFETTVDLSKLNFKPFKLKGDINGYFDFVMPSTGDVIKFKFLTVRDLNHLKKLKGEENKKIKVLNIRQLCTSLMDEVRDTDLISYNAQQKIKSAVEIAREEINKNYDEENDLTFSHELTDRLLLQTVSVNGITDRKYVDNYIFSMNVKDAAAYRKYILENEPGVDFNIEVERPESLGGGSIKSFLRLDQFIFINV